MSKAERLKSQQRKSCGLILGMHRSGTSALAGVLSKLGCEVPANALSALAGDATDSFESTKVRDLNDELLASAGSAWDDFTPFHQDWLESPPAQGFLERAVALLEGEFGNAELFVLKDPRICRLVPFWIKALENFGCIVKPILIVRNPLKVSRSLLTSNGISEPLGQMMWLRHALDAELATRGMPRFHTSFEQLMLGWEAVAQKAQDNLQMTWPKPVQGVEIEVAKFLNSDLHHNDESPARVLANSLLPEWLRETYEILNEWAEKREQSADHLKLDRIKAEFDIASNAFARLVRAERDRAGGQNDTRRGALRPQSAAPSGQLDQETERLKQSLQEQRRQRTLMHAEIHQLEAQLLEAQSEIAASRARRKEMARVITNREAKVATLNGEMQARYQELAALQRRILRFSPSWWAKASLRQVKRLMH